MKKQNLVFLILVSMLALGACDKLLTGSSNLVGTWDIKSITQSGYTNGSLDTTSVNNDVGTITFNKAGDGSYSMESEDQKSSGTFDWFEKNDKVFINMMNLSDSVMTKNLAVGFDVETNTSTHQVWSLTYSYYEEGETASGATVNYLKKSYMEMDLQKQ